MGYRGKVVEHERARQLRALGWTYAEICAELGVSRSSVSLWVRDVEIDEEAWAARASRNRNYGARRRRPHRQALAKQAEIERTLLEGRRRIGRLTDKEFLAAGAALYAGEGAKRDGSVGFANSDPRMIRFFCAWLRHFFVVDESRLRLRLYLHDGLDLDAANRFWSDLTDIPIKQFLVPYRATPHPGIHRTKHPMGCPSVVYSCSHAHRAVMGFVEALLTCDDSIPG
ncbi:hypothetical protein BH20ACT2_BH20ACT2_09260 [soil metagenome]